MKKRFKIVEIGDVFGDFTEPYRFRFFYGGRGGGKSWTVARVLLLKAIEAPIRVLCVREYQRRIKDSVKKVIEDQIKVLGLEAYFEILKEEIRGKNGSEFLFYGMVQHPDAIRGTEGVSICWVEEAASVTAHSLEVLRPTIRAQNSEIWFTFNPHKESDAVFKMMETFKDNNNTLIRRINWDANPWFGETLDLERRLCLQEDKEIYAHIWEGECLKFSDSLIFKDKFDVCNFATSEDARFFHGVDFGFASDPTAVIRCYIENECLFIDREIYGVGIEIDELEQALASIETARTWPVKADNSRPETISYLQRKGFNITGAKKWSGSVEDGISYLKNFRKIIIHENCKNTFREFMNYSYKVDKISGDILPIVIDKDNHTIDAIRYALDGYITSNDALGQFENLGR